MIHSILCYVSPSVEFLGPTTPSFQTRTQDPPPFSNQIDACVKERVVSSKKTFLLWLFAFRKYRDEVWIQVLVLDTSVLQNDSLRMDVLCGRRENDKDISYIILLLKKVDAQEEKRMKKKAETRKVEKKNEE